MLDNSNTSQLSRWSGQALGESVDNLSLLGCGDFSFSYDSDVSIATTLVEGIVSHFPNTQDLLDSMNTADVAPGREGSKSVAYAPPQLVLDSASDEPQCSDSNVLLGSVQAIATTEAARRSESSRERLKELWERRFTCLEKMKPCYAWGGR